MTISCPALCSRNSLIYGSFYNSCVPTHFPLFKVMFHFKLHNVSETEFSVSVFGWNQSVWSRRWTQNPASEMLFVLNKNRTMNNVQKHRLFDLRFSVDKQRAHFPYPVAYHFALLSSVVRIVMMLRAGEARTRSSILGRVKRYFFSSQHLDCPWRLPGPPIQWV